MKEESEQLKRRITTIEQDIAMLKKRGYSYQGIRKRSNQFIWGLPLYDVAIGPDAQKGEIRGYARGIIPIGDIATGVLALGAVDCTHLDSKNRRPHLKG